MQLKKNDIHIWSAHLDISLTQQKKAKALLTQDECDRAHRYHFAIHQDRFIASRAMLRYLIGLYLSFPPRDILFGYTEYEKPYILSPFNALQFNLSHSENIAFFAFSLNYDLGIDVEKMKEDYPAGIAERFFSQDENKHLTTLSETEKKQAFYRLWSRKEAIIKATGKGLSIPLSSFSVSTEDKDEIINLNNQLWSLLTINSPAPYQAAIATNQTLNSINLQYFPFTFCF